MGDTKIWKRNLHYRCYSNLRYHNIDILLYSSSVSQKVCDKPIPS